MRIHYFQRYHEKENVATANTMLLLSRLYSYSSDKFFRFLKSEYFSDSFNPEIIFTLQEKSVDSIPDATITQEGFKIVVETKMSDWFYEDQLLRHLNSFGDEKYKVMITLAPELMDENKNEEIIANRSVAALAIGAIAVSLLPVVTIAASVAMTTCKQIGAFSLFSSTMKDSLFTKSIDYEILWYLWKRNSR